LREIKLACHRLSFFFFLFVSQITEREAFLLGIAAQRKKEAQKYEKTRQQRLEWARAEARRIAVLMAEIDPEIKRILLFGSLAREYDFTTLSDIDLLVYGGNPSLYEPVACSDAIKIDVIAQQEMQPAFKELILSEAKELFVRQ
jgi:predicted nucleotidyltransferase